LAVKKIYCSGSFGRGVITTVFYPYFFLRAVLKSALTFSNAFARYKLERGMSIVHDWRDWLGGLPFEVASRRAITEFFGARGFELVKEKTTRSLGINEYVFVKRIVR